MQFDPEFQTRPSSTVIRDDAVIHTGASGRPMFRDRSVGRRDYMRAKMRQLRRDHPEKYGKPAKGKSE